MGKFDGILLCTDFDRTFADRTVVSRENCEAVRYFEENGGRFTVVSGRHPAFLRDHQIGYRVNAPLVGYNGGLIMDANTEKMLYRGGRNDLTALMLVRSLWERDERISQIVLHDESDRSLSLYRTPCDKADTVPDFEALLAGVKLPIYNVLCVSKLKEDAISVARDLNEICGDGFVACRSWAYGVELICAHDQKGVAAKRLKHLLGAELLVTVGDFENDVSMLQAADIAYAVENAEPVVKAVADRITVPYTEHAIAAIVEELSRR